MTTPQQSQQALRALRFAVMDRAQEYRMASADELASRAQTALAAALEEFESAVARHAQAAAPGVQGWMPIETAPKNQEIVGAEWQSPGGGYPIELMVSATTYQDGAWRYPSGIGWQPTHWVPRLTPPLPESQPAPAEGEAK